MKKEFILVLVFVFTINSYAQINFEKGYYISNSGQKIECLIKNKDWRSNPTEFEYKLSENDKPKILSMKSAKEFTIYKASKYIRKAISIDRSPKQINKLSIEKNPILKKEELFLKVLVEGKANLYSYVDVNLIRYFYNIEQADVEQLIYKKYRIAGGKIGVNNRFRQQLWSDLKCSTINLNRVENLSYKNKSLINFFTQYNTCSNSAFINYEETQNNDFFNLTLRPRLRSSSIEVAEPTSIFASTVTDFGNDLTFGFGVEAEFILPFNKDKWSIFIEPTYQSFNAENTNDEETVTVSVVKTKVNYNSIEVPIGLRHYFFLTNTSKIFINAAYVIDFSLDSSINFERNTASLSSSDDIEGTQGNLALGIGYKLKDKYGIEVRYQTNRDILGDFILSSDYKTISLIFGYSLF